MYYNPKSHQKSEYGYRLLGDIFRQLTGADFMAFYIFVVAIGLLIWLLCTRKLFHQERYGILLLLFMPFYGYFYFGVTIRNALAEIIVYGAFVTFLLAKRYRWILYVSLVILASFIHRSSLAFLIVIFFANANLKSFHLLVIYGLCVCFWLMSGFDFAQGVLLQISQLDVLSKVSHFANRSLMNTNMFSLQNIVAFIMMLLCIMQKDCITSRYQRIYSFFLNVSLVGLFVMSLFWHVPTAYRFYNMFFFFNFPILYLVTFHNKLVNINLLKYSFAVLFSIIYFSTLIYCNPFFLLY